MADLATAMRTLANVEELALCEIFADASASPAHIARVNSVFDSIKRLSNLKAIDLSKNKLHKTTLDHLLVSLPTSRTLEIVSLSQINLTDSNLQPLFARL